MIVGVDAGNTRLKWRSIDGCYSGVGQSEDEVFAQISRVACDVRRLVVSSVRGQHNDAAFSEQCRKRLGLDSEFYYTEPHFGGLSCAYERYQTMGADRWMAILGAWQRYQRAVLVIDIGTAITIDYVDSTGAHVGGYIAPGYHRLVDAINSGTQLIDVEPLSALPVAAFGSSTSECLSWGCGEMLSAFVNQTCLRYPEALPVYAGGGHELIRKHLVNKGVHHHELVFDGLFERAVHQTLKN